MSRHPGGDVMETTTRILSLRPMPPSNIEKLMLPSDCMLLLPRDRVWAGLAGSLCIQQSQLRGSSKKRNGVFRRSGSAAGAGAAVLCHLFREYARGVILQGMVRAARDC